jgi:hypothetical protein
MTGNRHLITSWIFFSRPIRNESDIFVQAQIVLNSDSDFLTLILAAWVQILLPKHKTAVTSLIFIKKLKKIGNPP